MAGDALLSDLCSTCNNATFKYRCPGCAARTCSLPCYKRHQQWAQCNGKRDPTKFVKKSQLATPAGIDHDYNFLTGIERGIERAEKQVEGGAFGTPSDPRHDATARGPTDQQFLAAGVTVIRAPKGLSRQKENKTRRSKKTKNITWTVEWIYEDTTRVLTESTAAAPILQIQPFRSTSTSTRKRKRDANQSDSTSLSAGQNGSGPIESNEESIGIKGEDAKPELSPSRRLPREGPSDSASAGDHIDPKGTSQETIRVKGPSNHHSSASIPGSDPEPAPLRYSFFLLKPRTSSTHHVLIPLDPNATLGDCLNGRTVLEYPTIYVFSSTTVPPPTQYMLESEYIKQEAEDEKEFDDFMKTVDPQKLRALDDKSNCGIAEEQLDSDKILDVLKQDIGAGV